MTQAKWPNINYFFPCMVTFQQAALFASNSLK